MVWEQKDHPGEPVAYTGLMGSLAWEVFWTWSGLNSALLPAAPGPLRPSSYEPDVLLLPGLTLSPPIKFSGDLTAPASC